MLRVKTLTPNDSLQDGFEPAPNPPVGPDGGPILQPAVTPTPPRPRLCEAGPCRHYHQLEIQVEAQEPKARLVPLRLPTGTPRTASVPNGTMYYPAASYHTAVHHYCYPDVGIEIVLGSVPVVHCNRFRPHGASGSGMGPDAWSQHPFWSTKPGIEYLARVAQWEAARAAELEDADVAELTIEGALGDAALTAELAAERSCDHPSLYDCDLCGDTRCTRCEVQLCEEERPAQPAAGEPRRCPTCMTTTKL